MSELIDPTESKIPLWILVGMKGKPKFDGGKMIHASARFFLFGFYLDKEHCDMAKVCMESEMSLSMDKVWVIETEANHMWVWDITDGP